MTKSGKKREEKSEQLNDNEKFRFIVVLGNDDDNVYLCAMRTHVS